MRTKLRKIQALMKKFKNDYSDFELYVCAGERDRSQTLKRFCEISCCKLQKIQTSGTPFEFLTTS